MPKGAPMTHDQATSLVNAADELLALGDRLDTVAHALADAGHPQANYQSLVDATGHIAGAIRSTLDTLEAHQPGGRSPR